mmetsp:Transcript_64513/g.185500  ORF Transcript_64513/g.185500 Transcript_64513/m.185500 type:complete len:203 (+) Transcript_64513:1186-1794(+)
MGYYTSGARAHMANSAFRSTTSRPPSCWAPARWGQPRSVAAHPQWRRPRRRRAAAGMASGMRGTARRARAPRGTRGLGCRSGPGDACGGPSGGGGVRRSSAGPTTRSPAPPGKLWAPPRLRTWRSWSRMLPEASWTSCAKRPAEAAGRPRPGGQQPWVPLRARGLSTWGPPWCPWARMRRETWRCSGGWPASSGTRVRTGRQ